MLAENWGTTRDEQALTLPCDDLLPAASFRAHRAISVQAPTATTFRWLCQLREAPYSYDLLDNFGRRSPRKLTPGAEVLRTGQRFMRIFRLVSFAPNDQITLMSGRRTVVTYAVRPDGAGTRLLVRILFDPPGRLAKALTPLLALGDLVMMRKQLRTLKTLAEGGL